MEASLDTDAIPGFVRTDIDRAMLRVVPDPEGTVLATENGRVVGYCTPLHDDLTVHPGHRRRGHGDRLLVAALELTRRRGHAELQLYVPSHLPGSVAFARSRGLRYRSSLWLFELSPEHPVPAPEFPTEVVVRAWDPVIDTDFEGWAAFLLASFEGHPTEMTWTPAVIRHIHAAPDFNPSGVLIVSHRAEPDRPIAFSRIELTMRDDASCVGSVGLIGVLPSWRRRGLGRELLRWGVTELRARGAGVVELSVEAANERATNLYRAHGFTPSVEWPHWVLSTHAVPSVAPVDGDGPPGG